MKLIFFSSTLLATLLFCYSCMNLMNASDECVGGGSDTPYLTDIEDGSESSPDDNPNMTGLQVEPGQLTAGEWNDLENWDFWRGLFDKQNEWDGYESLWKMYTHNHYIVKVTTENGPVNDVSVGFSDMDGGSLYSAKTDAAGVANLFVVTERNSDDSLKVIVSTGNDSMKEVHIHASLTDTINLSLPSISSRETDIVDLLFMVDATGSMSDELEYLKVEIADVVGSVEQKSDNSVLRMSVNFYRDEGDEYVVRSFPFTEDIATVQHQIAMQKASGGGDYPEAVHSAMIEAINEHEWSNHARARLLFLVLDAPPHKEQQIPDRISSLVQEAAEKGIRIVPVASSGVDKETEYILRSFSILTNGTYIFLTNHSGIGNDHIEPTIGQYDVRYLNELLADVINRYCDW